MKYRITLFFILMACSAHSQVDENAKCYVLNVKGEIRKPWDSIILTGDTLRFKDVKYLKFINEESHITIYQPAYGSFRVTKTEIEKWGSHESFGEFLGHLLKIKGRRVSLSSRGDCTCLTPIACFYTDTVMNNKILLVDSLTFSADERLLSAERGFYFIRYNEQNRKLRMLNGNIQIAASDFVFRDTSFITGETPEFTIGLYIQRDGGENTSLVANVRFNIVNEVELQEYYRALKTALPENDIREVNHIFSQDVYMFFGKPTECQLEKIINSIN